MAKKKNIDKKIEQEQDRIRKERRKTGFYYSFVTIILLCCVLRIGFSAVGNITKVLAYKGKIITLEKKLDEAETTKENLKKEISAFSVTNVEDIGRNVFKMAKKDEIEIIIDHHSEDNTKNNKSKNKDKNVK